MMVAPAGAVAPAAAQEAVPDAAAEVAALERALVDALHAKDQARMEQLLAAEYVLRSAPDVDRATWIANALEFCWGDRSDITDLRVDARGDAAISSFELAFYTDPETCNPGVFRSLITDVWRRAEGRWQLQVRHSGPVPSGGSLAGQFGIVPELPPTWVVNGEFSFVATAGNASTQTLGLASDARHQSDRRTTRLAVAFLTSEADEVTRARALSMQGRHGYRATDRLELFGRAAYARDRFAGIANREAIEGGVAYRPGLPPGHTVTAEAALGFTAEQRLDVSDLTFATATGTATYVWAITRGTELQNAAAVVADLATAGNWRGTSALSLSLTVNRLLSLKTSHALEYRNFPVPGFRRLDTRSSAALVLTFERRPPRP